MKLHNWVGRQDQDKRPKWRLQWAGRQSDWDHGAQCPPPPCSRHRTRDSPGQGPPKGTWPPSARPPSPALLREPSADGQRRPTQILPEGEVQVDGLERGFPSPCWGSLTRGSKDPTRLRGGECEVGE